jgi:hypothetical protein
MMKAELDDIPLIPWHIEGPALSEVMIIDAEVGLVVTTE